MKNLASMLAHQHISGRQMPMTQLSALELRTLAAAQIAAAMVADQPRDTIDDVISDVAEIAVKLAKAIEQAAGRSMQSQSL